MENIVAARRLRKSMLKKLDHKPTFNALEDIGVNIHTGQYIHKNYLEENLELSNGEEEEKKKQWKEIHFKTKVIIKIFLSVIIVFSCLICKLFFAEQIQTNQYISMIIQEYQKDYTKGAVIEKMEDIIQTGYQNMRYIIPEELANKVKYAYVANIKPLLVNFDLKESVMTVFQPKKVEENMIYSDIEKQESEESASLPKEVIVPGELEGKGGGEPIKVESIEASSAISIMEQDVNEILSKKIDIQQPVHGTITSRYGAREQIFDEVNPYHTGIDIANVVNTPIPSASVGTVTKVQSMDKYYGNNVEVTIDGVIFKYAHMNSINVKVGDKVDHASILGYMGSTGMSTGSHLHFEIKIHDRTVDPELILKIT